MKILFVAKHSSGGNDDEGAVAHALDALGHEVLTVSEDWAKGLASVDADLCLFFKWGDVEEIKTLRMPKVFWYFDLVQHTDPLLRVRCMGRVSWFNRVINHVDLGFCTDGDWVDRDQTKKLVWLTQGADGRIAKRHAATPCFGGRPFLLFTGITRNAGAGRAEWYDGLRRRFGHRLVHVERGVYRRELASLVSAAQVVVCPDQPVTDRYFSNRIFNAAGFGACVIHPRSADAMRMYAHNEVMFYSSRDELFDACDKALADADMRARYGEAALERTRSEHTYLHRTMQLLDECRRLGLVR